MGRTILLELLPQVEERIALESVRLSRRVKQSLDGKRQRAYGLRRYIWRSQDDAKVRASHAANDNRVFEWDNPPPTGHPGEDYGCRCFAEPMLDGAEEPLPEGVEVAVLVNPATVEVAVIIVNALDKLNKARKLLQAARAADALAQEIQQQEEDQGARDASKPSASPTPQPEPPDNEEPPEEDEDKLFERPEGVPEEWERKPAKKGEGTVYEKPGSKGATYVKIQKGNPNSSQPGQKVNNIRWVKDGKSLDRNGNVVPRNSEDSHIPLEKFSFDKGLFK